MSCLNDKRMKDINHVRALAKQFSNGTEQNVDIISLEKSGVGKVYDFTPSILNKQKAVETIVFFRDDPSPNVLSDNEDERSEIIVVEQKKKSKRGSTVEPLDEDS